MSICIYTHIYIYKRIKIMYTNKTKIQNKRKYVFLDVEFNDSILEVPISLQDDHHQLNTIIYRNHFLKMM